jgi:hypothetical protein
MSFEERGFSEICVRFFESPYEYVGFTL